MKKNDLFEENYKYAMEHKNFLLLTNKDLAILLEHVSNSSIEIEKQSELLRKCLQTYGDNMFILDLVSASAQRFCELILNKKIK